MEVIQLVGRLSTKIQESQGVLHFSATGSSAAAISCRLQEIFGLLFKLTPQIKPVDELPYADLLVGWCGGWGRKPPGCPIGFVTHHV